MRRAPAPFRLFWDALARCERAIPRVSRGCRNPEKKREEMRELVAHLAPVDDHVDGAVLEQELRALKTFGQRFPHRLLNDARTGEADQCARLGDHDVTDHREACGYPTHRG